MNHYAQSSRLRRKRMFNFYTLFLILCSLAIILMPIVSTENEKLKIFIALDGILFWIGTIGTILMALKINKCRKNSSRFNQMYPKLKRVGLIHFFQNTEAFIADIVMFVSVIGFILVKILTDNLIVTFIFLGAFVFAFGMHCMLNGTNYVYINYRVRRSEL